MLSSRSMGVSSSNAWRAEAVLTFLVSTLRSLKGVISMSMSIGVVASVSIGLDWAMLSLVRAAMRSVGFSEKPILSN